VKHSEDSGAESSLDSDTAGHEFGDVNVAAEVDC
jgi:hypothetical protein